MSRRVPNVLSVAGSDPSGGAGIQADLKTFAALEVYGCAALTALTAQNTLGVSAVLPVPPEFLRRQLDAVFGDVRVDAVKIGMLGSVGAVRAVADAIREHRPPFVVLDPVLRSTSGARLLDAEALAAVRDELMPLVSLVTPNVAEAGALLDTAAPHDVAGSHLAAERLVRRGANAVLVTGGHLDDDDACVDVLHDGTSSCEHRVARAPTAGTHGTGCTLSSAIAALVAREHALGDACVAAQRFVARAIAASATLRVGHGLTPVHQAGATGTPVTA